MTVSLHDKTEYIPIRRDVRQDDTISPKLYITVFEYAFKQPNWEARDITQTND